MKMSIMCNRKTSGATLALMSTIIMVMFAIGFYLFCCFRYIAGYHQVNDASDFGILNAAKQAAIKPAVALSSLPNQDSLPYNDFVAFADQQVNGNAAIDLLTFNRCIGQLTLIDLNARIIASSNGNSTAAQHNQLEAQAVNNIGSALQTAFINDRTLATYFGQTANSNSVNFFNSPTDITLRQNLGVSYVHAGGPSNIYVPAALTNTSLLPNPASISNSAIPLISSSAFASLGTAKFLAGYTPIGSLSAEAVPLAAPLPNLISGNTFANGATAPNQNTPPNALQDSCQQPVNISPNGNSPSNNSTSSTSSQSASTQSGQSQSPNSGAPSGGPGGGSSSSSSSFAYAVSAAIAGSSQPFPMSIPNGYVTIANLGTPADTSGVSNPDAALYDSSNDPFNRSEFAIAGPYGTLWSTAPVTTHAGTACLVGPYGSLALYENFFNTNGFNSPPVNHPEFVETINNSTFDRRLDPLWILSQHVSSLDGFPIDGTQPTPNGLAGPSNEIRVAAGNGDVATVRDLMGMVSLIGSPTQKYNITRWFKAYNAALQSMSDDDSTLSADNSLLTNDQNALSNASNNLSNDTNGLNNAKNALNSAQTQLNSANSALAAANSQRTADQAALSAANTLLGWMPAALTGLGTATNGGRYNQDLNALANSNTAANRQAVAVDKSCLANFPGEIAAAKAEQKNGTTAATNDAAAVLSAQTAVNAAQASVNVAQGAANAFQSAVNADQNAVNNANGSVATDTNSVAAAKAAAKAARQNVSQQIRDFLGYNAYSFEVSLGYLNAAQVKAMWKVIKPHSGLEPDGTTGSLDYLSTLVNRSTAITKATSLVPFVEDDFDGAGTYTNANPWLYDLVGNLQSLLGLYTRTTTSSFEFDVARWAKETLLKERVVHNKPEYTMVLSSATDPISGLVFAGPISGQLLYPRFEVEDPYVAGSHDYVKHYVDNNACHRVLGDDRETIPATPSANWSTDGTPLALMQQDVTTLNGPYPPDSDPENLNNPSGTHTFDPNNTQYVQMLNLIYHQVLEIDSTQTLASVTGALNSAPIALGQKLFMYVKNGQLVMDATGPVGVNSGLAPDCSWGANDSVRLNTGWYEICGAVDTSNQATAVDYKRNAFVNSSPDGTSFAKLVGDAGFYDCEYHAAGILQMQDSVAAGICTGYDGQVGYLEFSSQIRGATSGSTQSTATVAFHHPN